MPKEQKQLEIKPAWMATFNQRLKEYQRAPELLAEDLLIIFSMKTDPEDKLHNHLLAKLLDFCPDYEKMLKNVAIAIIKTAKAGRTGE